eukprot:c12912_g1_i1.p1 GENE.c12912_g1_i1~~c12912_g1_i1.p1  ORF type:complete len:283 (-),score=17.91 c12912_g1_i1:22-819(-)
METDEETEPFFQSPRNNQGAFGPAATIRMNALRTLFQERPGIACCVVSFRCLLILNVLIPIFFGIGYYGAACDKPLAIFLLVYGLSTFPVVIAQQLLEHVETRTTRVFLGCFIICFNIFSIVWFIQGCVWVFNSSPSTCNTTLYHVTFYIVVFALSFLCLLCFLLPLLFCCFTCCLMVILQAAPLGTHGMSPQELEHLQSKPYHPGLCPSEDANCSICLSSYENGENITSLSCQHHFHTDCIKVWLKTNAVCPICRTPVGSAAHV